MSAEPVSDRDPDADTAEEKFERFTGLTKRLFGVSKRELDEKVKQAKRPKRPATTS